MNESQPDLQGLAELARRQQKALNMGGEAKISKQHGLGRLTARERIAQLLDKNSFYEVGQLAVSALPEARDKTPADGKVCGFGTINQQQIGISADDATVMAGAGGKIGYTKEAKLHNDAQRKGLAVVHLGDGGGARIPDIMGSDGQTAFVWDILSEPRNRQTPLITAIMGECYGGPTWAAATSDVVIQVKGTVMAVVGPPVLAVATGEQVTPQELGGWEVHARKTGLVDLFAENETDCFRQIRRVLSYLPPNAQTLPPTTAYQAFSDLRNEKFLQIIPNDERYSYDMQHLLRLIADKNSLLELKPFFDGSLITAWGRMNGQVVGFLANNPKVMAGAMGPGACEKALSFIILCDSFHIPLLFLHDTPGFFVSKAAEEQKMPLRIMNVVKALQYSSVPKISLIVRKSYGMAHVNMLGANMGADFVLAWPKAEISFMSPNAAAHVLLGKKLENAADPMAARQAFLDEMAQINAPWAAAERGYIDRIIDPRDTRTELLKALRIIGPKLSQRKMASWPKPC